MNLGLCSIHIYQSCFFQNLFETCSFHLCGLFYTWILKPELRMAWIFMDSQTGNDEFWHFSRFQKLVSVWYILFLNFEQKHLKQQKITKFSVRKSMNIHRILQFGLKLIIPGRLWRCKKKCSQKNWVYILLLFTFTKAF